MKCNKYSRVQKYNQNSSRMISQWKAIVKRSVRVSKKLIWPDKLFIFVFKQCILLLPQNYMRNVLHTSAFFKCSPLQLKCWFLRVVDCAGTHIYIAQFADQTTVVLALQVVVLALQVVQKLKTRIIINSYYGTIYEDLFCLETTETLRFI